MDIHEDGQNGAAIIAPRGRIDSTTSDVLEKTLSRVLESGQTKLVIDLAGVDYISSAGLRVLLVAAKRLGGGRGSLVLCSLGDAVRQVFDLAGFLPLFAVAGSRDQALTMLGAR